MLAAGHRVITYDRRGAGGSSQPASGYDWDTFAADLAALIDKLDLDGITLVGHSMGTGEVTRYLGTYGSGKVDRAVLIGPIPPYLSQVADRAALEAWMDRLDELNIGHTGIRRRPNGLYSTVVFRDPDNNQLEFAAPAPLDADF